MNTLINLGYLVAAALFIFGLKGLGHPRTAVRGNLLGAIGMLLAVLLTLLDRHIISYEWILIGLAIGTAIGVILAVKVQMTQMPQLVALFNGFGGGASVLVAGAAIIVAVLHSRVPSTQMTISTAASGLIGAVTFWGSLVAFAKLQGVISSRPAKIPAHQLWNGLLLLISIGLGVLVVLQPSAVAWYWLLVTASSILGVLMVMPIGGADMPVVISLLNSLSGLAAASTGFVLNNSVLIIAGSLVGASGIILTNLMCKAMNRPLSNVLFGGVGATTIEAGDIYAGKVKSTSPEEVAMLLEEVRRVVIVPGYGMAVAQAQYAVRDLANLLESRGVEVLFGIHPVAGRMPGHMNVLLAEANVPYDKLKTMEQINPVLEQTDVAIVIGANDTVNPAAREANSGPLAGMPIIEVDKARTVVVIKRSLSPGFAGVPNPLFAADNTLMLFGDGKQMVVEVTEALQKG